MGQLGQGGVTDDERAPRQGRSHQGVGSYYGGTTCLWKVLGMTSTSTVGLGTQRAICNLAALGNYLAALQLLSILIHPLVCDVCEMRKLWKE